MSQRDVLRRIAGEQALRVAIDGPAGAGKSTVGRGLADWIGCFYLDTGLMYRAITWLALGRRIPATDEAALESVARTTRFSLGQDGETLFIDSLPSGDFLRTPEVDLAVSAVSAHPAVRTEMVSRQRELAEGRCIVMVGRDIGTVVLPEAPVKLWVTASAEERARRRLAEGLPGSETISMDDMVTLIKARDARDESRPIAPLKRPLGAVEISTDQLSPEEALQVAVRAVRDALRRRDGADLAAGTHEVSGRE